jgi:hypothetical protein
MNRSFRLTLFLFELFLSLRSIYKWLMVKVMRGHMDLEFPVALHRLPTIRTGQRLLQAHLGGLRFLDKLVKGELLVWLLRRIWHAVLAVLNHAVEHRHMLT